MEGTWCTLKHTDIRKKKKGGLFVTSQLGSELSSPERRTGQRPPLRVLHPLSAYCRTARPEWDPYGVLSWRRKSYPLGRRSSFLFTRVPVIPLVCGYVNLLRLLWVPTTGEGGLSSILLGPNLTMSLSLNPIFFSFLKDWWWSRYSVTILNEHLCQHILTIHRFCF